MRVRMNLMQLSLVVLPLISAAQPKQLITSVRNNSTSGVSQSSATAQTETGAHATEATTEASGGAINTLPLFGERPKTAEQIDQEVHFLNDCDQNFASRPEASDFFAARGWDYVADGQLDTAAHRFNLAWLLNDKNADAYWGLGVVCYQKNQLPDAIRMLKRGLSVADSNAVLMTDLATVQIKYHQEHASPEMLDEAEAALQRAVALTPANATSFQKLSLVSYLKADYAKAWDYFHQARNLDLSQLDLNYLNDLLAKHPDPKGVFK
ncbi:MULTISPECIES: tetratricopeptide repeat protein [Spirosoma]|uniref:Tetratricopeptide repeat protein n=1 Tax=Spirosoma sordidisoli TaxID=2502893 RepID=A0A4Q2ULS1_9BACT|nr:MULTISPECIES: tetratricopeptide repeat protein [Spirosoma]RYC67789.1 tetratricopeptide repeat protein [Spirosoma sordidisoli]